MLSDLEKQFQTTLRQRVPSSMRDDVQVTNGKGNQKGILVGIRSAVPLPAEFGGRRPEPVPGAGDPRRVVRLRCQLDVSFVPSNNQERNELMEHLDQVLYALDAADMRDGSAFTGAAPDPGFLLHSLAPETLDMPFITDGKDGDPLTVALTADGWFWPVGETGQTGSIIGEVRLRGVVHPVRIEPASPSITAGGAPITLDIRFGGHGTSRITEGAPAALAFGNLAARLEKPDGTAGDGTLTGGNPGTGGVLLLPVVDGLAEVTYTPPNVAATDVLVLAADDGKDGSGIEIGRFALQVRAA